MLRFAPWKLASVIALVVAAILLVIPSFFPAPAVEALAARLPGFIPLRHIVLGLDLQGGAHMLMQVDEASVVKSQVEALRDDVRQKMREGKIALSGGIATQPRGVLVRIADPAERSKAYGLLQSLSQPIGGPLAGGNGRTLDVTQTDAGVQLTLTDAAVADKVRHAVSQSIEVLNRRVNAMGTKETMIQQQGVNRVLVQVPGLQDTTKLKEIIGQTAKLEFRLVADPGDPPNEVVSCRAIPRPCVWAPTPRPTCWPKWSTRWAWTIRCRSSSSTTWASWPRATWARAGAPVSPFATTWPSASPRRWSWLSAPSPLRSSSA